MGLRGSAMAACLTHTQKVVGSSPTPATTLRSNDVPCTPRPSVLGHLLVVEEIGVPGEVSRTWRRRGPSPMFERLTGPFDLERTPDHSPRFQGFRRPSEPLNQSWTTGALCLNDRVFI